MDTLYDSNSQILEHMEESEANKGNSTQTNNKVHRSTFDIIPVLTSKRMRCSIKHQIIEQLDKINK